MKRKYFLLAAAIFLFQILLSCATESNEKIISSCDTTAFVKDTTIQPVCGLTVTANHIVIKGLVVPSGEEFVLYARTDAGGNDGGVFTFNGSSAELTASYRGGTAAGSTISINDMQNWLIGFHEESPSVHVVVKNSNDTTIDPEGYTSVIDIEPDLWLSGSPADTVFYYKATNGVVITSLSIFYEEHDHAE